MKIVLATGNTGKLREIRALVGQRLDIISQADFNVTEAVEDGETFCDNALIKAQHAYEQTGLAAIADDSGLEVDCLDGNPGVHSARYAGIGARDADNVEKLLRAMSSVEHAKRAARFRCCMVYYNGPTDPPLMFEGSWEGRIAESPRGASGFGYDPVFLPDGFDCSAAELPAETKNANSHRAKALRQLVRTLL